MRGKLVGIPMLGKQRIPVNIRPRLFNVIDAYDYLNEVAFGGEMRRPTIVVWARLHSIIKGKKQSLLGAYEPYKNKIWIKYGEIGQLETLFHEMVHQYMYEVLGEPHDFHNKLYWDTYNECERKITRHVRTIKKTNHTGAR